MLNIGLQFYNKKIRFRNYSITLVLIFILSCSVSSANPNIKYLPSESSGNEDVSLIKPLLTFWQKSFKPTSVFTIHNSLIVQGNELLSSVAIQDGSIIWKTFIGDRTLLYKSNEKNHIYYVTELSSTKNNQYQITLHTTDSITGITRWSQSFSKKIIGLFSLDFSLVIYFEDGSYTKVDKNNGDILQSQKLSINHPKKIALLADNFLILTSTDEVICLDIQNNKPLWAKKQDYGILNIKPYANSIIYMTSNKTLNSLDAKTGKVLWNIRFNTKPQEMIAFEDGVLVTTTDNAIAYIDSKGKQKWKRIIEGKISSNFLLKDGYLLMFPIGSNIGIVIELKNGQIKNKITLEEDLYVTTPPTFLYNLLFLSTQKSIIALTNPN